MEYSFDTTRIDIDDENLRATLARLQEIAEKHLAETHLDFDSLTGEQQVALIERLNAHLAFEFTQSEDIALGMPFIATGDGGFLASDKNDQLIGAEDMHGNDAVVGIIAGISAYPVPSRQSIINSAGQDTITERDRTLSVVIALVGAELYRGDTTHDLGIYTIFVPVAYHMHTFVAHVGVNDQTNP